MLILKMERNGQTLLPHSDGKGRYNLSGLHQAPLPRMVSGYFGAEVVSAGWGQKGIHGRSVDRPTVGRRGDLQ